MTKNKLIIAAAGSGKTQFIVKKALENQDSKILIVTYTINNKEEIRERFDQCIPKNVTITTWFSFLLQHGAKPYKYDVLKEDFDIKGILFVNEKSGKKIDSKTNQKHSIYWGEEKDIKKHYFTKDQKIYTDKLSKFSFRCNEKSEGLMISRLSEIYTHIFIDEVQDLAGYDLELLNLLLQSKIKILMVGDPRQVVYLTHHEQKHAKYKDGKIQEFIEEECNKKSKNKISKLCEIDKTTLNNSYRNCQEICDFASKLYPNFSKTNACNNHSSIDHVGVFLVKECDVEKYLEIYQPTQLVYSIKTEINNKFSSFNFGVSKGKTFDRVLIYPTIGIVEYLKNGILQKETKKNGKTITKNSFSISSFYVALTRAKYSVGIVLKDNQENSKLIEGIKKWENTSQKDEQAKTLGRGGEI